jgi:hypothetical protein
MKRIKGKGKVQTIQITAPLVVAGTKQSKAVKLVIGERQGRHLLETL